MGQAIHSNHADKLWVWLRAPASKMEEGLRRIPDITLGLRNACLETVKYTKGRKQSNKKMSETDQEITMCRLQELKNEDTWKTKWETSRKLFRKNVDPANV